MQRAAVLAVVCQHDRVVVADELGHVLRDLLEPQRGRLLVKPRRRELDDAVALRLEPVEQRREQRLGDDGDLARAWIGAERHSSRASSRRRSSSGS